MQVVIKNTDFGKYNHYKNMGYVTAWSGNGLIALKPKGR